MILQNETAETADDLAGNWLLQADIDNVQPNYYLLFPTLTF